MGVGGRYRFPTAAGPDEPHAGRLPGGRRPDREGIPGTKVGQVGTKVALNQKYGTRVHQDFPGASDRYVLDLDL